MMRHSIAILILSVVGIFNLASQDIKEYYFKFNIENKSELETITNIISIDNVKNNEVFAYAMQYELEEFLKLGYKIKYLQKQAPKSLTMATTVAEMANWDRYPTYEVYREMMKNFESDYPSICKLDSIGTTNDGRELYVLRISDNVDEEENEPEFFYTSTMHGDETTGYILMLRLVDSLLSNYNSETEIKNLIDEIDLYINPNANPDGTYASGNNTVSGATRSNGFADLNRDYPDPRAGANSPYELETQAMMDFAEQHHFVMSANFHGGAAVMNYPWDTWYTSENLHADTDWFEQVCTDYVTTARTVNSSYMNSVTSDGVTHGATWYKIDGGRQDYMNYWHQCREITIELSDTKLLPTESLNNYWNYNKQSLINYMKEVLYGIRGTVKSVENTPLNAEIWVINHDEADDSSMVFTSPVLGNYHRLIEPGTYDVVASAEGYIPDTVKNISVSQRVTTWVNFKLISTDDSISLNTNFDTIQDTLYFNESSVYQLIIFNDSNAISTNYTIDLENEYNWIGLNKNNGTIFRDENDTILVTIDTDLLNAGYFSNNLVLNSEDGKIDTIPVGLIVKDTISTEINPNEIIDTVWAGEKLEYEILIKNDGILSLNYDISIDPEETNWISLDKSSGNLVITEQDTINVTITSQNIGFGDFSCDIIVEKESSTNDTIPVSIYVKDTISYSIIPEFITDTLNQDSINIYQIIVKNNGYSNIDYTTQVAIPTKSDSWAYTNDTSGTIIPGTDDTIKVIVNTLGLNAGDYSCALQFNEESGKETLIPIDIHVSQAQNINKIEAITNVNIYPNPFENSLILECFTENINEVNICMYNTYGILITNKNIPISAKHLVMDLSEIYNIQKLQPGIYLIRLSTGKNWSTHKVIKR